MAWALTCLLAIGTSISMIEFRNYETNYRNLPIKKAVLEFSSDDLIEYNWFAQSDNFVTALEMSSGVMMGKEVSLRLRDSQ